ncbi:SHOCT domain-containing protein [Nonomuraea pusilla]|uniref:Putative membrane protein n=1 Tax=Nonomuraea pusilla TaxID=46177 RepID=A0A1H8B3Y7_9ACTN|nr:SHOCT domain-containing protein [Nonomuraea pusilla]SEM76567.1 putative membrane protein [Nonomuraea pusilla]
MMHHTFTHAGWGMGPVVPLLWGLFWVAVVGVALWARRTGRWRPRASAATPPASPTASAEQILAERYARGEMGDDEYFEKMSVLRGATG